MDQFLKLEPNVMGQWHSLANNNNQPDASNKPTIKYSWVMTKDISKRITNDIS